jgi:broad specificity phosphatase PhoE
VARHPQDLLLLREDPHHLPPGGEAYPELEVRVLGVFGRAKQPGHDPRASHCKPTMTVLAHALGIPHQRIWQLATAPASLTSVEVWADGGTLVTFVKDTSHLRSSMSIAP